MEEIQQLPDWSHKTLLIAEDLDDNYAVLAALLKKTHIKLMRAKNGFEAIRMINEYTDIDVILMDLSMPEISGIEATHVIKQQFPQKIVIAQTAHYVSNQMEFMTQEGFNDILLKPIQRNLLIDLLNKYLS